MKIVKGILIGVAALFILFGGLVIASAFQPAISEKLGEFLYTRLDLNREDPGEISVSDNLIPVSSETPEDNIASVPETLADPEEDAVRPVQTGAGRVTIDWNDLYKNKAAALYREDEEKRQAAVSTTYVVPDEKKIKTPTEVAGKSGYQEIKDTGETLEEEEIKKLSENLDYGNLGSLLVFDPLFYPYFNMLSSTEKNVYRQIYANANDLKSTFTPMEDLNAVQMRNVFAAVCHDHPELFWLDTAYTSKYDKYGICRQLVLSFNSSAGNLTDALARMEQAAGTILLEANRLATDYEKEKYVHDVLCEKATYNASANMNQSAYSALVNGQTVCAGYARAFQYLMIRLGIPTYYCAGSSGENHAWNIVKLGNDYYNVDVTWDDASKGKYDYFNKTDADFATTHVRKDLSVKLPPCNGVAYRVAADEDGNVRTDIHLKSLSDVGLNEGDVFRDIWSYYEDCQWEILANGNGYFTFSNVIEGEKLYEEWQSNNAQNLHWDGYVEEALKEFDASYCHISMTVEELQGDRYLITHTVTMQ